MGIHLSVFCQSERVLTRRELAEFVSEGCFFEVPPVFDPAGQPEASDVRWNSMEIRYAPGKRPVAIERLTDGALFRELIEESIEKLLDADLANRYPDLVQHLRESRQVFLLEVGVLNDDDDCWEMLDAVEAYIASELGGVVEADDGFYDQNLLPICKLR